MDKVVDILAQLLSQSFIPHAGPIPKPTLLCCPEEYRKLDFSDQENWGKDEWKFYAQYLENHLKQLSIKLKKSEFDLRNQKKKSSRRKKPLIHPEGALLTGFKTVPKKKRGRKPGSGNKESSVMVNRVIELKNKGDTRPNTIILNELISELGRMERSFFIGKRGTILNLISKKSHNNS